MGKPLDVKLTIRKCTSLSDWYALARESVPESFELVPTGPNSARCRDRSRLDPDDADVEGTAEEWREIAEGIEQGLYAGFKRCEADTQNDGSVILSSPRNSQNPSRITRSSALYLSKQIKAVLSAATVGEENG